MTEEAQQVRQARGDDSVFRSARSRRSARDMQGRRSFVIGTHCQKDMSYLPQDAQNTCMNQVFLHIGKSHDDDDCISIQDSESKKISCDISFGPLRQQVEPGTKRLRRCGGNLIVPKIFVQRWLLRDGDLSNRER